MNEVWKEVPGYPDYEASSLGAVRRSRTVSGSKTRKVLKQHKLKSGYLTVVLYRDKKPKRLLVNRVVLASFNGWPEDARLQAAHIDGNRLRNHAENLTWKTSAENGRDKIAHGTAAARENHGRAVLTEQDVANIRALHGKPRTKNRGYGRVTISRELGLPLHAVSNVLNGRTWQEAAQ